MAVRRTSDPSTGEPYRGSGGHARILIGDEPEVRVDPQQEMHFRPPEAEWTRLGHSIMLDTEPGCEAAGAEESVAAALATPDS